MHQIAKSSLPPHLSVVIVIVSDTVDARRDSSYLMACLEALTRQNTKSSIEFIVPYTPPVEGIGAVQQRFPEVRFIPVDNGLTAGTRASREHHDELRARGLAAAHGEIIGLLEDHAIPDSQWCECIVTEHRTRYKDYAAVGGAIENGINHPINWAVYFCDFGKYQNPVSEGESPFVSDANVGYKRQALESIRVVWQDAFHETTVNAALAARGEKLALSREVVVFQHRMNRTLDSALRERFVWGRSYAATRIHLSGHAERWVYAALTPVLPFLLLTRMTLYALGRKRHIRAFIAALPLTALLTLSWSYGELVGYITARTE